MRVVKLYQGKRRNECPPHLWAITETAYRNMISDNRNQSMLITGESGAGKTENTKKVISYLAMVATTGKKSEKKASLEDQIVATNPILESYGNAKTSRNDNSSRFGKFIRIHFSVSGKLAGCDIKAYLFEKSRITQQQEVERSYHIFYQLLQPAVPDMKVKCNLAETIYEYSYVSQGRVRVDSIDDNEELQFTDNAFDVIGFSKEEKWDCYKLTAGVMTMGDLKFKQKGRDEQCEPDKPELSAKVGELFGVDSVQMMSSFTKPKIKVGTEWVVKGQNVEQAVNAVGGIARAVYHRTFLWLIEKCNETLISETMKKANFCAVLDIAGFEIFTFNGYEQLSINFVNEKLQQFFNHHMFVVEQEEYIAEGIDWQMVDFGMDLAACIIMFEKPMGVWAILEEESLFPKATDKSFEEKLKATLLGKCPTFAKPQSKTDRNAHFAVVHYAGTVSYNVTSWLEKNKDPVNDTVVDLLKSSSTHLMVHIWRDHQGQRPTQTEETGKKKKGGGAKTVSSVFLVDLNALMAILNSTDPHFVRCIVPNTCKQPGGVDSPLIMHQLTCNGVLEGIRICMRGFPNRLPYIDFQKRYGILARGMVPDGTKDGDAAQLVLDFLPSILERSKLGHTKVFFRAGALAQLEERRDEIVEDLARKIQGCVFGRLSRKVYDFKCFQRKMLGVIQRTMKKHQTYKNWKWFSLIHLTRPLIGGVNMEQVLEVLGDRFTEVDTNLQEKLQAICNYQSQNFKLKNEIAEMRSKLSFDHGNIEGFQEKSEHLKNEITDLKFNVKEKTYELTEIETVKEDIDEEFKVDEEKCQNLNERHSDLILQSKAVQSEVLEKEKIVRGLNNQISENDSIISKLSEDKKQRFENVKEIEENLIEIQSKQQVLQSNLNEKVNIKENICQMIEDECEKKRETDITKKDLESELTIAMMKLHDSNNEKKELEQKVSNLDQDIKVYKQKLKSEIDCATVIKDKIRDLENKAEEIDHELQDAMQDKMYAELSRSDLARSHEQLTSHLEESLANAMAQSELNGKLDARLNELRKEKEEQMICWESSILKLKKRHQEASEEMQHQMDILRSMKNKAEKDIISVNIEIIDVQAVYGRVSKDLSLVENSLKTLKEKLSALGKQAELKENTLTSYLCANKRTAAKNSELDNELKTIQKNIELREREVSSLRELMNQATANCEFEEKENKSMSGKVKNLEHEHDEYLEQFLDEESCRRENQFNLDRAVKDANLWRLKYEKDIKERVEELEFTKVKLQTRLVEAQDTIETLSKKLNLEDMRIYELER